MMVVVVLLMASVSVAVLLFAATTDSGFRGVRAARKLKEPARRFLDIAIETDGSMDDALSRWRCVALAGRG